MNAITTPAPELIQDLRSFVRVCEELLTLANSENQALAQGGDVEMTQFTQTRKDLLGRLNEVLVSIKNWRKLWQQQDPAKRTGPQEIKPLLEVLQQMIVRILQLDRENQQSLLRAGRLPARHVPPAAAQQPSFVARLYSRHHAN